MRYYILIETINDGTFFYIDEDGRHYYEIYRLSEEQQNNIIELLDTSDYVVQASNQIEALKKLSTHRGTTIYKFANKEYYENILPINV